jgi:superfamily II DNA or RNA helicase
VEALWRHREQLEIDLADDRELDEAEREALEVASGFGDSLSDEETEHLARLNAWAERAARREDVKCTHLLDWLDETLRPGGVWNDERVIIFTEYRDTQRYLRERLAARGVRAERVAELHGGMNEDDREHIKAAFQAAPNLDPSALKLILGLDR